MQTEQLGNFMEEYQRLNNKYYSIYHLWQEKRVWCSANVENSVILMLLHKYFCNRKHYLGISQGVPIKELQDFIILPVGMNIMCLPHDTINFKLKQQSERLRTVLLKSCLLSSSQLEHLFFSSSENFRTLHSNNIVHFASLYSSKVEPVRCQLESLLHKDDFTSNHVWSVGTKNFLSLSTVSVTSVWHQQEVVVALLSSSS